MNPWQLYVVCRGLSYTHHYPFIGMKSRVGRHRCSVEHKLWGAYLPGRDINDADELVQIQLCILAGAIK